MKVVLVSAEYPPETDFGGLGAYVYKLARALSALGHQVTVVSSTPKGEGVRREAHDGVTVYRVPRPRWTLMGLERSLDNVRYSLRVYRVLQHLIEQGAVEVIQFPEYLGEGLAHSVFGRIPYVVRFSMPRWLVDEINRPRGGGVRTRINRAIDRWVENTPVRRGRAFIFPSRDIMEVMKARIGVRGLCRVVYPGVDAERFAPCQDPGLRGAYGIQDEPVVLYVGRLEYRKGVHTLADAAPAIARRFPNARFVFAGGDTKSAPGGGSMRAYLEQRFAREGLQHAVRFLGGIGHRDVARIYGLGDLLVVPSIYENLANVLLEGMASGLPIVTTSGGGSPEIVTHGSNGLVVPPEDPAALGGAVVDLLADPEQRRRIAQNNRDKAVKELSLERMGLETIGVYTELLQSKREA